MTVHLLEREQFVRRPLAEVFEFFSAARNLERRRRAVAEILG